MLIYELTSYCREMYNKCTECTPCTHPTGKCSGSCRICSEEINWHGEHPNGRIDYNCSKYLNYYVCRYSWKYCSEIIHALELVDLSKYPKYKILSIGCGGAPDLMAFEYLNENKEITYHGYDITPDWETIHDSIERYCTFQENMNAHFSRGRSNGDFVNSVKDGLSGRYNVIIMEYVLSHIVASNSKEDILPLFHSIGNVILHNRYKKSPFLIIINDIDFKDIRYYYNILIDSLKRYGLKGRFYKMHFKNRTIDYSDGSIQHENRNMPFIIPYNIDEFNCAIELTSQLIVEVT